jgi:hypothetical protein
LAPSHTCTRMPPLLLDIGHSGGCRWRAQAS